MAMEYGDTAGAFDLHMHSVYSDGSETVEELIASARDARLAGIAVTDHDCLRQLSSVRAAARDGGVPVLAGVEVSAMDPATGRKLHVLAYGLEATADGSGPLEQMVEATLFARTQLSLWQAWTIIRSGETFDGRGLSLDEAIEAGSCSTGFYRQHLMEAFSHLPNADERHQACVKRLFKGGGIADRSIEYPAAEDAVRAIREQGGVAVLAHPGQMDSWAAVPGLVRAGLQGIEVHHPDHSESDVARAREIAVEYGLFATGGSDYHGKFGKPEAVGCRFVAMDEAGDVVASLFEDEARLS